MNHRFVLKALIATIVATLFAAAVALPASAVDNGTVGIRPANESDFFHLSIAPGATIETAAIISNHSTSAVTLLVYPVDATNTPSGGFAFGGQKDSRTTVGVWSTIAMTSVEVKANSELRVPIQVSVPAGTVPGDYAGGLIIESPRVIGSSSPVDPGGAVTRIDVIQRQGVRIYLHVTGQAVAKLSSTTLNWTSTSSAVNFTLPITNTGTTILHPKASLRITSSIGSALAHLTFNTPQSVLPGQTVVLHATLPNPPLLEVAALAATVTSEATAQKLSGTLVLIAWWVLGLVIIGILLLAVGTWRTTRYVRRSREAFRTLAAMTATDTGRTP